MKATENGVVREFVELVPDSIMNHMLSIVGAGFVSDSISDFAESQKEPAKALCTFLSLAAQTVALQNIPIVSKHNAMLVFGGVCGVSLATEWLRSKTDDSNVKSALSWLTPSAVYIAALASNEWERNIFVDFRVPREF